MAPEWECKYGGRRKPNGNTELPAEDGLPAQGVRSWALKKHARIRLYIEATHAVRAGFLPPRGRGGAAFVDLFAGPGRARIQNQDPTVIGSPLIVLEHEEAPFTRVVLCDRDPENADALRRRTASHGERAVVLEGDCNERIEDVLSHVPEHGLNLALLDPFGPKALRWSTIRALGEMKRMDLLIHFPTGSIKRNFNETGFETIDALLGTRSWRDRVHSAAQVDSLMDVLHEQLVGLGYESERVNRISVLSDGGLLLYHLTFASKDPRGVQIWKSITRHDGPQRGLPF